MMKNNILNNSPTRTVLFFGVVYIVFVVIITYLNLVNKKQTLYQHIDKQLEDAAMTTQLLLPSTLHNKEMKQNGLTERQTLNNIKALSDFTDQRDVNYIYTLILRDDKVLFTSSSATLEERQSGENLSYYFDHYDDVDPRVLDIFKSKKRLFLNILINGVHSGVFSFLQFHQMAHFILQLPIFRFHTFKPY